ncbi:FABP family protein [Lolliginicoccus levis]|uniref:FABP family protein n=1 Tax=Lolliginicoccus levis TaxID=2919542 RepID=UPI00241D883F|nr:FABP family protein [Lolliginicoccus levis]
MTSPTDPLHELAALAGTWHGTGHGHYPTIEEFDYREEIELVPSGKPFLFYRSRTWNLRTEQPMHTECGYLRRTTSGSVELLLSQPTGFTEIHATRWHEGVLEFHPVRIERSVEAKPVHDVRRKLVLDGDRLVFDMWMAHAETPLTHHLHAEYTRG